MNPHRVRRPREDGAALRYLTEWRRHVEFVESLHAGGGNPFVCCSLCDEYPQSEAREALERLMRRGGRRAHRLRVAVEELDNRFRAVTEERGTAWRSANWWCRRIVL